MKVVNRSQFIAIILTIVLFAGFMLAQVFRSDEIYGLQPYVEKFFTDFGEPDRLFNQRVAIQSGEFVTAHTSLMRTAIYSLSEGGLIDSQLIFRFGSIVIHTIYALLMMMIVIVITRKVQNALVAGILVFTSPYFIFQSPFLIPQTIAILFVLMMIWGFEKYRETERVLFMVVVSASLVANAVYEPTSILISIIIMLAYTVNFLFNEDPRKIEVTFLTALLSLILLLPMFGTLLGILSETLFTFGDNSRWGLYVANGNLSITVNTFLEMIGYPVAIFSVLGVVAIVAHSWKQHIHFLVILVCIVLLMVNFSPRLQLSPNRMQSYLYVVLVIISAIYCSLLFSRTGRLVRMAIVSILITFGVATMLTTPPWQRLNAGELEVAQIANQLLADNPDATIFVEADVMVTAILLDSPQQICAYWDPVFQWYVPPSNGDVPDCTRASFRIAPVGSNLPDYRIVMQTEAYAIYERIVNP